MPNETYYQNKISTLEKDLQTLHIQMEQAGVGTKGDYLNQIDNKEQNILFYKTKLQDFLKAKTPNEFKVFLYVIVSTKDKVKQNIGDDLFKLFEVNRYHEFMHSEWQPFSKGLSISILLKDIIERYGVNPIYLDSEEKELHLENLDTEIHNSIAIIDLFSFDNVPLYCKFDTAKCSIIIPLCRQLNIQLVEFADNTRKQYLITLNSYEKKGVPCQCYAFNLSDVDSFQSNLLKIMNHKFPIKNQAVTDNLIRNLDIKMI